jgi:hypothetical protein
MKAFVLSVGCRFHQLGEKEIVPGLDGIRVIQWVLIHLPLVSGIRLALNKFIDRFENMIESISVRFEFKITIHYQYVVPIV